MQSAQGVGRAGLFIGLWHLFPEWPTSHLTLDDDPRLSHADALHDGPLLGFTRTRHGCERRAARRAKIDRNLKVLMLIDDLLSACQAR